jgi:ABC-type enterochelin transport system ATPase subunit
MIHAKNLTKNYGSLCAVDHINLDIKKGEIVGFLGRRQNNHHEDADRISKAHIRIHTRQGL